MARSTARSTALPIPLDSPAPRPHRRFLSALRLPLRPLIPLNNQQSQPHLQTHSPVMSLSLLRRRLQAMVASISILPLPLPLQMAPQRHLHLQTFHSANSHRPSRQAIPVEDSHLAWVHNQRAANLSCLVGAAAASMMEVQHLAAEMPRDLAVLRRAEMQVASIWECRMKRLEVPRERSSR